MSSLGLLLAGTGDVTRAGTALALPGVRGRAQLNSISIEGHRKAEERVIQCDRRGLSMGKVKSSQVLNRVYPKLPDFGKYILSHARVGRSGTEQESHSSLAVCIGVRLSRVNSLLLWALFICPD